MQAHNAAEVTNAWKGILATVATWISGETLESINQLASIFAHVCAGLAGLATAAYTIRCWVKGKAPQAQDEDDHAGS